MKGCGKEHDYSKGFLRDLFGFPKYYCEEGHLCDECVKQEEEE